MFEILLIIYLASMFISIVLGLSFAASDYRRGVEIRRDDLLVFVALGAVPIFNTYMAVISIGMMFYIFNTK